MQNTGQGCEKKSYRVLLLLVVGLAAFSSAMKELNQVQDLSLQAGDLFAQAKEMIAPVEDVKPVSVETCQNSRTLLPPPVPALPPAVESNATDVVVPEVVPAPPAPPAASRVREVLRPKRVAPPAHSPAEVRLMVNRRFIFVTPEGRDMLLKTLNRGINLRSAS
jgi:hypothetical protein